MKDSQKITSKSVKIFPKFIIFSVTPLNYISLKTKQIIKRAVGSACKPARILNRSAGSGLMHA
jgi:hypothetical protein